MGKTYTAKSHRMILRPPLPRIHYYQNKWLQVIRTLPPEIQQNILTHKAITSSYDKWMYLFKVLVSTAFIRTEDMTGDIWLSHKTTWYQSFGDADSVYERTGGRYNPYPGLLINTETEDPVICDPLWLSEIVEAGFINKLIITSAIQISLFTKVIQEAAAQIGGLNYMKMEIWSTLPVWDTSYYMETQPSHILVLIYDWGCIPEYNWYTGDTYLSKDPRLMTTKDHVPIFLLISYCPLCNDYGVLHEHEQYQDNSDPLDYDNYADTD